MPSDQELAALKIQRFEQDPRKIPGDELLERFGAKSSGKLNHTALIRSLLWWIFEGIESGELDPIESNVRSSWYRYGQPIYSHLPKNKKTKHKTDPYQMLLQQLSLMVQKHGLFRYGSFDFTDEHWEVRRIGTRRPHVIVFAEKRGWMRFLKRLHDKLGVSVQALGGVPSALTSEYALRDVSKAIDALRAGVTPGSAPRTLGLPTGPPGPDSHVRRGHFIPTDEPLHLVGIVDYDPAGDIAAEAFKSQLEVAGAAVASLQTVIHPKHYTRDEIGMFLFEIPKGQPTKNAKWIKKTGGIDGAPFGLLGSEYGLESESMEHSKVMRLVVELVEQIPELEPNMP